MSAIPGLTLDGPINTPKPKQNVPIPHGVSLSVLEARFPKPLIRHTFSAPTLLSIPEEEEEFSEIPAATEAKADQAFDKHHYRPS